MANHYNLGRLRTIFTKRAVETFVVSVEVLSCPS
jgi:hypothetical protein